MLSFHLIVIDLRWIQREMWLLTDVCDEWIALETSKQFSKEIIYLKKVEWRSACTRHWMSEPANGAKEQSNKNGTLHSLFFFLMKIIWTLENICEENIQWSGTGRSKEKGQVSWTERWPSLSDGDWQKLDGGCAARITVNYSWHAACRTP